MSKKYKLKVQENNEGKVDFNFKGGVISLVEGVVSLMSKNDDVKAIFLTIAESYNKLEKIRTDENP